MMWKVWMTWCVLTWFHYPNLSLYTYEVVCTRWVFDTNSKNRLGQNIQTSLQDLLCNLCPRGYMKEEHRSLDRKTITKTSPMCSILLNRTLGIRPYRFYEDKKQTCIVSKVMKYVKPVIVESTWFHLSDSDQSRTLLLDGTIIHRQ